MTITTVTTYINNPTSGTHYASFFWSACFPSSGASADAHVQSWSGINGTGSLTAVSTLTAMCVNQNTNATNTITGNNADITRANAPGSINGSDCFRAWGWYTGSAIGSLAINMEYSAGSAFIPQITSISVSRGRPTDIVTISGAHFQDSSTVQFNGNDASFSISGSYPNDTSISATVPTIASSTGTTLDGHISVNNPAGGATSAQTFAEVGWKVWDGSNWQPIIPSLVEIYNSSFVSETQTNVYDGSNWILIG